MVVVGGGAVPHVGWGGGVLGGEYSIKREAQRFNTSGPPSPPPLPFQKPVSSSLYSYMFHQYVTTCVPKDSTYMYIYMCMLGGGLYKTRQDVYIHVYVRWYPVQDPD